MFQQTKLWSPCRNEWVIQSIISVNTQRGNKKPNYNWIEMICLSHRSTNTQTNGQLILSINWILKNSYLVFASSFVFTWECFLFGGNTDIFNSMRMKFAKLTRRVHVKLPYSHYAVWVWWAPLITKHNLLCIFMTFDKNKRCFECQSILCAKHIYISFRIFRFTMKKK